MDSDPNAAPFGGTWGAESSVDATEDFPPIYTGDGSNDDFDKATDAKMAGSDLKSSGNYEEAIEKYSEAILAAEPSALLLANRAHCLFKLNKYAPAIRDCDEALKKNPDSAKALRIRGECYVKTSKFAEARKDLSQAQSIDYDSEAAMLLKEATEKCAEMEAAEATKRNEEKEKLRKRAEEIKKVRIICTWVYFKHEPFELTYSYQSHHRHKRRPRKRLQKKPHVQLLVVWEECLVWVVCQEWAVQAVIPWR